MSLFLHGHQQVIFGAEVVVGPSCGDLHPFGPAFLPSGTHSGEVCLHPCIPVFP